MRTLDCLCVKYLGSTPKTHKVTFMSKLTFLTREYLLRYKTSYVIKFVWFVFDKILQSLVCSYFYVKIDFPDQKMLRYVSKYVLLSFVIFSST